MSSYYASGQFSPNAIRRNSIVPQNENKGFTMKTISLFLFLSLSLFPLVARYLLTVNVTHKLPFFFYYI